MNADELRRQLAFYQDLGFTDLYRRTAPAAAPEVPVELLPTAADTLPRILEDIGDCKRCRLHEARHHIVFGSGDELRVNMKNPRWERVKGDAANASSPK